MTENLTTLESNNTIEYPIEYIILDSFEEVEEEEIIRESIEEEKIQLSFPKREPFTESMLKNRNLEAEKK